MTAPLRCTPRATALSASQTAPVAEFRCLFTHDVRRKQKRWQDGYLKFHSFNSRVMVYDQARNHIGDTYYKDGDELHEGDELNLDRGVMVEVAEAMGITQTDLTPLLKKPKEPSKELQPPARPMPSASSRPFQRPTSVAPTGAPRAGNQLRHKSLNTLLGTPKGPAGKAMPMKSPYDARKELEVENEFPEERAPKRQKTTQRSTAWRASSPLENNISPNKAPQLLAKATPMPSAKLPTATASEVDPIPILSSPTTPPSTPGSIVKPKPRLPATAAPIIEPKTPSLETTKPPRSKVRIPTTKVVKTPKRPAPPSSPPVSASNRLTNVDFAVQAVIPPQEAASPPPIRKGKSLRLPTGVKRGTLMCQSMPKKPVRASSEVSMIVATKIVDKDLSPPVSNVAPPSKKKRTLPDAEAARTSKKSRTKMPSVVVSDDEFDDPEIVHGLMDQQLLVASSPPTTIFDDRPPPSDASTNKPTVAKNATIADHQARKQPVPAAKPTTTKSMSPALEETIETAAPKPKTSKNLSAKNKMKNMTMPAPHIERQESQSRRSSTSPTKAPSAGGFRKKTKRPSRQSIETTPTPDMPVPRPETVALPPHPLRNEARAPMISTTALVDLLEKSNNHTLHTDPIEDDGIAPGKSPNRNLRRVRSENDAPIPSVAEDWERDNTLKPTTELQNLPGFSAANLNSNSRRVPNSGLSTLIKKTDPRKKFQRTKSLTVETSIPSVAETTKEVEVHSPVVDDDVGPWSSEAFFLFDWRPPGR